MNGFETHGIKHLSASSINLWTSAPDLWVARYILRKRMPFSAAADRGIVVESAVVDVLLGESMADAIARAYARYDERHLIGDEETTKQRDMIAPMTEIAVAELSGFGRPVFDEGDQRKVSITAQFGDWSIPVIGYLDFVFPDHGLIVDLKTTTRAPSVMSPEHQVQRAIYARASGNSAVKFMYVTPKKAVWLEDGNPTDILAGLKAQILRIERFLSAHDADSAAACVPVNPHHFFWRGAEDVRREIYGL